MINKIKKALNLKTNRELANILGVNESQITRWSKTGFHKSTEALLNLLFLRWDGCVLSLVFDEKTKSWGLSENPFPSQLE